MAADPAEALAALRRLSRGVPGDWTERALRIQAGEEEAAPARDASTVVLLRDGREGLEAYLLRRVATMAFAAGMYVYPGGRVDPRDAELPVNAWDGPPADDWAGILHADAAVARALVCAAVRETFEESGVLLAGEHAGEVVADTTGDDWETERQALIDRSLSFASLLERRGLVVRADLLRPWAHWITPEAEPRRYDTRFFVAALPEGQRTRDVGGEADQVVWLRPQEALRRMADGDMFMMPPTAYTLAEFSGYDTVDEVLEAGSRRDVKTVLPKIVVDADETRLLLPHEEGYPA